MPLRVTAVIPCYNAAPFIADAIASIRAQTRPVHEILVVDDASTDDSAAIAERLGARVHRQARNAGSAAAANVAAELATGDVLARLDADDLWEPNHCELLVALLEQHPEAGVAFGATRLFGQVEQVIPPRFVEGLCVDPFFECFIGVPGSQIASMVRRDVFRAVGGFRVSTDVVDRYADDFDLWMRVAAAYPIASVNVVVARYRIHGQQMSGRPDRQLAGYFRARARMREVVAAHGDTALLARMDAFVRDLWQGEMRTMWGRRAIEWMRWYLEQAPLVPGLDAREVRFYRRRAALPSRLLLAADRVGGAIAGVLRHGSATPRPAASPDA